MTTLQAIASQLLFIIFPGLVLHRALAVRFLALDEPTSPEGEIRESDLVVYGLLPALAIASTIGTVLAAFGLFRTTLFAATMIAAVIWRWRDAWATLAAIGELFRAGWLSLARGELMVLIAVGIFAVNAFGLLIDAQLPSENVDIWNHNLPLAQSVVSHAGYFFPQIPNPFYGTYPLFFHMLFAEGLLFVDHVIAAKVINTVIYLSFLLSLLFCARRARSVLAIALLILIVNNPFFTNGASDAMTDVPRASFSVLALTFTYRYLRDQRLYFLFAAGLLAGGAVGGKYTEMLTPVLIGLSLLPQLVTNQRRAWAAIGIFCATCLIVGSYPYFRNWYLLGNPIFPFVFGHPGLSDEFMTELFTPFDPAHRSYVTNLFRLQGWHDFFISMDEFFFSHWDYSNITLGLVGIGLFVRRSYIIYPAVYSLALAIAWYTAMFTTSRWALTAYLMLLSTAFLSVSWVLDRNIARFEPLGRNWRLLTRVGLKEGALAAIPTWLSPNSLIRAALAAMVLTFCFQQTTRFRDEGLAALLPNWINKQQAMAVLQPGGLDPYLARTRRGFQIYRFIGDHDLKMVFQPFDNGANFYQAAYNGGHNGNWILPWYLHPTGPDNFETFLRSNNVRYFVYRTSLNPVEAERLGPEHVKAAEALFQYMLPKSQRILVDPFGWELYAFDGAPVPPPS